MGPIHYAGFRFLFPAVLVLLFLSACAQAPLKREPADIQQAWQTRHQALQRIESWELKARIGIVADGESGSAGLYWEQRGEFYTLRIIGPFGRGNLLIEGSPQGVTLRNADGETAMADNPEELIWRQTGWIIPVSDLRYWILGLPSQRHSRDDYQLDTQGRIERLDTEDWAVEYRTYKNVAHHELPGRLHMQTSRLQIKLAVSEWRLL